MESPIQLYGRRKKRLEDLLAVLKNLLNESEETAIIVEGKKDRVSLRKLGVRGKIICMKNSCKTFYDLLDEIELRKVILLLDFDEYGSSLARNVTQYLEEKRVKVNNYFWRKIRGLIGRNVKDIEGLPSYLEKLKRAYSNRLTPEL